MNQLIQSDEILMTADYYAKRVKAILKPLKYHPVKKKKVLVYKDFYVLTDNNPIAKYMVPALNQLKAKEVTNTSCCTVICDKELDKFDGFPCEETEFPSLEALSAKNAVSNAAFFVYVDCEKVAKDGTQKLWLESLKKFALYAQKGTRNRCVVCVNLPKYPAIPGEVTSLAEREFSYYIEECIEEKTPAQQFYIDLEKVCRGIVGSGFHGINILRIDNLFGPDIYDSGVFDLKAVFEEMNNSGKVTVKHGDFNQKYTVTYIRDALTACFHVIYSTKPGHVFNHKSGTFSLANIKSVTHSYLSDRFALEASAEPITETEYFCINSLKFQKAKFKSQINIKEGIYRTVCCALGIEHDNESHVAIYSGKLGRIKELEIQMLADVDRICRENGIKYFLAGGTMLGALRYGHSIPWDDDFDIGMLREDFDKFRAVIEKELDGKYCFCSNRNNSGNHYIVDKIRLKDTYFSTNYSSVHEIQDGVFIDVLVYDKTSNNPKLNMPHSKLLAVLSVIIQIRWYNRVRKNFHYKFSKIFLPFMRLLPIDVYHRFYEWVLTRYKNKKDAKFLIDSTGKLQKKGPMPIDGLEDTVYVDYDFGTQFPIPVDPTGYLTFDYGPGYLPEPTLTKKVAPHNFARIDLGEYIFENKEAPEFRTVNLKGELFESEK